MGLLQEELPLFIEALAKNHVIISAIHNHWIFTNPTLLYVHFQSVEQLLTFAQETVDFYHEVARKAHDTFIKNVFEHAPVDE